VLSQRSHAVNSGRSRQNGHGGVRRTGSGGCLRSELTDGLPRSSLSAVACTQAHGSRGGTVFTAVCLCVCLFFSARYLKKPMHRQTLHINVPRWVPRKPVYFGGQKVKRKGRTQVTKTLPAWVFALLWVPAASS